MCLYKTVTVNLNINYIYYFKKIFISVKLATSFSKFRDNRILQKITEEFLICFIKSSIN